MNKEISKRQPVGRQQVAPAAFEIRFSATDSQGELVEILSPNLDPQERNVPDPFKKRDKIPRNSGSGFALESFGNDVQSTSAINKQWINNNNTSQKTKLLKDSNNTSSNGFDASTKTKSWNSVSPESEKQERMTYNKSRFADRTEVDETAVNLNSPISTTEKRGMVDDESAQKHIKKRSFPVEEDGSDKENGFSSKEMSTQNLTHSTNKDLCVTNEVVVSTNKENMIKNNNKIRKTSMTTEIKDDIHTTSRPMDGIATPPATPPSSPPITPQSQHSDSVDVPQAPLKTKDAPLLPSPPSSAGSLISRIPRLSPSRPILTAYLQGSQEESEQQEQEEYEEQEQQEREERREQQEREVPEQQERGEHEENQMKGHSSRPRRPTISHDDMIIPTIAKKLKMNGQLPFLNHDALLGTSDEQDLSSENGYVDITNQVENLFDTEQKKFPERQSSVPELQQRKASLSKTSSRMPSRARQNSIRSRNDSKNVDPRERLEDPREQLEETLGSAGRAPKSDEDKKRDKRKSRREEYVLVIRDEDEAEEFGDIAEPRSSMSLTQSEPSMSTTTTLLPSEQDSAEHEHGESKSEETNNASSSTQPAQQGGVISSSTIRLNVPNNNNTSPPVALELERTYTSDPNEKKSKKHKKSKNKPSKETVADEDDSGYVKKSACCCIIC